MSAPALATYLDAQGRPRDGAPLGMLLSAYAQRCGSAPALVIGDRTLSFAELDAGANRLARHLKACGVGQGDRGVICMPNRAEFIQAMYALWKLGAAPCPISYRLVEGEFATIVALVDPRCVIGDGATHATTRLFINVDQPLPDGLSDAPLPPAVAQPGKILASGGSTGRPKLIIDPVPATWGADKASVFRPAGITTLNAGPLYHTMPYNYCILPLAEGSKTVCMTQFDPVRWLQLVEVHRPHSVNLVPTMMSRIAKLPAHVTQAADLSSIQILFHAAAPCPPDIKRWWIERIGAEKVLEVYGGTERIGSTLIYGHEWLAHPGSVGRPARGDEIVILDEDGQALPSGQVGEIHFRRPATGPGTKYGYIGADTRIRGDLDSFGDIGWVDADGFLYIADRRDDMVVVGGMNVYPAEIEAAIETHRDVLCCAVIGLPDDDLGSRLHAIVELAGTVPPPGDGLAFLASQLRLLSPYKRPRSIEFTHGRIRDDAGKVRRTSLRADRVREHGGARPD
ncbi:AMP-binding protein [Sphingobium sp. HBC34]|uniref:AMP-binding protein n=1 Tax=Sphingobium cyanobacteriorum TaxID=3063954 RepID=A0ABT8ZGZ4_9SPHN|nr:AMP-binding protein [Sphingobium sp. HBC34]MDO7833451.1 AMP-binding protein [Sphingobium sp. HBC34]